MCVGAARHLPARAGMRLAVYHSWRERGLTSPSISVVESLIWKQPLLRLHYSSPSSFIERVS